MLRVLFPLLALGLAACGKPDPPALVGRYTRAPMTARDNPSWRGIIGRWTQEYRADGHLIVRGDLGMEVDSLYRLDGDVLTVNDIGGSASCRDTGIDDASARYRVRFTDDGLHFEALRDECSGRRNVMTSHPMVRVQ